MLGLAFLACAPPGTGSVRDRPEHSDPQPDTEAPTGTSGSTGGTADTGGSTSTAETGAPDPCAGLPPVVSGGRVSDVPTSEEFAFDALGNVVNATESNGVYSTTFAGVRTLVSPGSSWEYAGARISPDGTSLTLCDEGNGVILEVDLTTGSRSDLVAVAGPNSIGWDRWGRLWIGANEQLLRFDPAVGGAPAVVATVSGGDLDGVTFGVDDQTVYFNDDTGGTIGAVELDGAGEVLSVYPYVQIPGVGGWTGIELDGMTTDVCGNLYVLATNGELTRVWTDRTLETLVRPSGRYTTAVNFGSGVGGWERTRLYVMDRSSGLYEIDVGVEGHPEVHLP